MPAFTLLASDYKTVWIFLSELPIGAFDEEVRESIANGWQPLGGPVVQHHRLMQAMVKLTPA